MADARFPAAELEVLVSIGACLRAPPSTRFRTLEGREGSGSGRDHAAAAVAAFALVAPYHLGIRLSAPVPLGPQAL